MTPIIEEKLAEFSKKFVHFGEDGAETEDVEGWTILGSYPEEVKIFLSQAMREAYVAGATAMSGVLVEKMEGLKLNPMPKIPHGRTYKGVSCGKHGNDLEDCDCTGWNEARTEQKRLMEEKLKEIQTNV